MHTPTSDIPDQNSAVKLNINSDLTDGDEIIMCGDTVNGTIGENLTSPEVAGGDLSAKDQQNTGENGIKDNILTRPEDIVPETAEDGNADKDRQVSIELSETSVKEAVIVKNSLQEAASLIFLFVGVFSSLNSAKMMTRTVDLRSDTVTKPSQAMRAAMANAVVDDDVLGCDPTAFCLETELATITGKEAALFVPSGTMGNLISVLVHCEVRGSEVILGDNSHIHIYENGGISTIGGVHPRTVKNNRDGTMDIDLIEAAIRDPKLEICYPTTRLICLETTHAKVYRQSWGASKEAWLKIHIDGARIFNASVIGGESLRIYKREIQENVLEIVGISPEQVRRHLTNTVQENVGKLESDHNNAKFLAQGLNRIEGLKVDVNSVETNILYFDILEGTNITAPKLCKNLEEHGILVIPESLSRIRLVLHYQISESDVQYTLSCIQQAVTGVPDENGGKNWYKNFGGKWREEKGIAMKFPGFVASFYYIYYNLCFAQLGRGNGRAGGEPNRAWGRNDRLSTRRWAARSWAGQKLGQVCAAPDRKEAARQGSARLDRAA
ncbi:hypothetical protein TEA_009667 [Camellia sinensis var. sinensis]|uniref:Aromatic amino acid beta-eliminating lyase/threonine aldolase domain-containing protein n=1 Tax=Camellia sinensis var. sinensis TaxID=542762 RepID=A0A4S4D2D9_CAMSN|nr:hypothetical protein TEA_009667 [Camellia sinensis var. sinensis]